MAPAAAAAAEAASGMDITNFVVSSRERAMVYGDYATYRTQLSGRLLNSRKKLGIAAKNRGKSQPRPPLTPDMVAESREHLSLQILTAERAWAHAMSMKAAHSADTRGVTGKARSHIVSRLDKAAKTAEHLADVLSDATSGAGSVDVLEARAYAALLRGAEQLEKQSWEPCLRSYATARIIFTALLSSSAAVKKETFKDLLADTVDPSIRYAAYQLKTPRSLPIPLIARKAFPRSDGDLVARINELDGGQALSESADEAKAGEDLSPTTLTFRSRQVRIEDAAIATAWLALQTAAASLVEKLASSGSGMSPKEMAAAYDDVLLASQDSADATKQAIDELRADGLTQSDPQMQSLAITRTAVNYEMISWRIGRNRVLTGEKDGAVLEQGAAPPRRRKAADAAATKDRFRSEPPGRQLAKLKEKVVLYDGTLQSLESVKELPGVGADAELSSKIDATYQYFTALKCLALGRSHAIAGNTVNALALIKHAHDECREAFETLGESSEDAPAPSSSPVRNIDVSPEDVKFLGGLLSGEMQRHRALVEIDNLRKQEDKTADASSGQSRAQPPLTDRLGRYPDDGVVDLDNIVSYPPKLEAIPVKPVFLDIAWNYIDYPDAAGGGRKQPAAAATDKAAQPEQKPQKKGWFGFGR